MQPAVWSPKWKPLESQIYFTELYNTPKCNARALSISLWLHSEGQLAYPTISRIRNLQIPESGMKPVYEQLRHFVCVQPRSPQLKTGCTNDHEQLQHHQPIIVLHVLRNYLHTYVIPDDRLYRFPPLEIAGCANHPSEYS